jgi:PAS domain S-box-containing protein
MANGWTAEKSDPENLSERGRSHDAQRKLAIGGTLYELQRAYLALEELTAQNCEKLNRTTEDLAAELEKCKDAETRWQAVSECFPYGAWIYRLDGSTEQVSTSYLEMLGSSLESIKQNPWFSFVHPADQERIAALWKEVTAARAEWNCEFRVTGADGGTRHILSRGGPLPNSKSSEDLYVGMQLDVSESVRLQNELVNVRRDLERQVAAKTEQLQGANRQLLMDLAERLKTECALRDSESQLRVIYENALDSMIVLDDRRRVLDTNESAHQLFSRTQQEMRRARWDDLIPVEKQVGIEERWQAFLQGGTKRGEEEVVRADGQVRLVAFSSRANILPGRHLVTLKDITDHREAEESLRMLSHRLMHLQDEERRRIARELHDSTGQSLALLRMLLDRIRAAVPELSAKAQRALDDATSTCESCTSDLRTISYLLHPPMLDEVGLLPALQWYVAGFRERSGIEIVEEISEPERPLTGEQNTALFRIIQEALTNIHKHAESREARIRLSNGDGYVTLEIRDSGKGFHAKPTWRSNGVRGLGVGITGMRERVRQLGGTLEVLDANPGVLVRAKFPVSNKGENHGNT